MVGRTVPPLDDVLTAPCGDGPPLSVNDLTVPTRVTGPRSAVFGSGTLHWEACAAVGLGVLDSDTLVVGTWHGFVPSLTSLRRTETTGEVTGEVAGEATGATALSVTQESPARMTAQLPVGPERVLATTQNLNPGWVATVAGRPLRPVTLDGYRQGFVVPAGVGGLVDIRFGPDTTYRWALLVGALLVLVLAALAIRREAAVPRATQPVTPARRAPWWVVPVGATALAALMAGPWGLLVGAVAAVLGGSMGRAAAWVRLLVVVTPALTGGVLQALEAPGRLGAPWLETTTRLLVLAALVLAVCVGAIGAPRRRADAPRRTS